MGAAESEQVEARAKESSRVREEEGGEGAGGEGCAAVMSGKDGSLTAAEKEETRPRAQCNIGESYAEVWDSGFSM